MSQRVISLTAAMVATVGVFSCDVATAGTGYPGVFLVRSAATPVYTTITLRQTRIAVCPRMLVPLRSSDLRQAAAAVATAMPSYYGLVRRPARVRIDARDAVARGFFATRARSGTGLRGFCGSTVWARSAFVSVRLPHVHGSASLSAPTFLVARAAVGWVIWAEVH